jgi:2,3-bisphosphoglycerate-independent phosphoglycerate mutase
MTAPIKYVISIPDGAADEPIAELGGRTPLEAAWMPTLAELASRGRVGLAETIPDGFPSCSSVGNMSILGYDPRRFHGGRAPIEAAALGIELAPGEVAYRCNLVTVGSDGTMLDFTGGHPAQAYAHAAVRALNETLGGEVTFHPGLGYRHIMSGPAELGVALCLPPHDLVGAAATLPIGPAADRLIALMSASRDILAASPIEATQIWLWGQGAATRLPRTPCRSSRRGSEVAAVDVVRGLGRLAGLDVLDVAGATGWYDTDYQAKRDAALNALAAGADLVVVHVEASDEAGHAGDLQEKIKALEAWDRDILAGLVKGLDDMGPWRLLLLPDHPTPVARRNHTRRPVPYLRYDSDRHLGGGRYDEQVDGVPVPAHDLLSAMVNRAD